MSNGLGRGLSSLIPNKNRIQPSDGSIQPKENELADIYSNERIHQVSPDRIRPNALQPRSSFDVQAMQELRDSIAKYGIIEPLIATLEPGGIYELVAGERRWRAAKELGLKTVPVILRTSKDMERLELALIENLQRQDLNPLEIAQAYSRLIEEFGLTHEELGKRVGKGRATISNALRLLQLPQEIKKALLEGVVYEGHARALLSLTDPEKQILVFNRILTQNLTVNETEREAAKVARKKITRRGVDDPNILSKEEELQDVLGTRVHIRKKGGRGVVLIEFYSEEELNGIVDAITNGR